MTDQFLTQDMLDELIEIQEFLTGNKSSAHNLIHEIRSAILDSGKLRLDEWRSLRNGLRQIEELIPVIDLIIRLKEEQLMLDKKK